MAGVTANRFAVKLYVDSRRSVWVVARGPIDADRVLTALTKEPANSHAPWKKEVQALTITLDFYPFTTVTKSPSEWCRLVGRGILCVDEHF